MKNRNMMGDAWRMGSSWGIVGKKLLSLVLVWVMCMGLFPAASYADTSETIAFELGGLVVGEPEFKTLGDKFKVSSIMVTDPGSTSMYYSDLLEEGRADFIIRAVGDETFTLDNLRISPYISEILEDLTIEAVYADESSAIVADYDNPSNGLLPVGYDLSNDFTSASRDNIKELKIAWDAGGPSANINFDWMRVSNMIPPNSAPTVTTNTGLNLLEGAAGTIGSDKLTASDVESDDAALIFTLKSVPTNGTLKNGPTELDVNDSFTQADIDAGTLTYTHDGSETTADSFTFDVSDGAGGVLADQPFVITVIAVNDAPTLPTNVELELDEGESAAISTAHLVAADVDNAPSELTYTVKSVPTNGTLKNGTTELGVNDTFAQADINAGTLTYTHDGSETTTDSFTFDLADGAGGIIADQTFAIKITAVNDAPTLQTNEELELNEGTSAVISSTHLTAADVDSLLTDLQFIVKTVPANGTLKKGTTELDVNDTFTQADIDAGSLTYTHDGSETTADSFIFDVADGEGGLLADQTFAITVSPVNDAPTLQTNEELELDEGASAVISTAYLAAVDVDNAPSELTYTVKSLPTNGTLENGPTVLGVNDTFTQADIDAGNLTYTHDGGETTTDSFTFDVADGAGGVVAGQTFVITITAVNDAPTLPTNEELELDEGTSTVISTAHLAAADVDSLLTDLEFIVKTVPANGTLKNGPTVLGLNDTFTQADIDAGNLTYTHDGSETTADSFTFDVSDGAGGVLADQTFAITVSPVNDAPTLQTNEELELDEGASAVISTAYLAAADVDNTFSELTYTVKSLPTNGTLENGTTVLGLNDTFTQADINAGILTYTHDGSETTTDSFEFDVADGAGGIIADQTFAIKITAVNDAPTLPTNKELELDEGASAEITTAHLAAVDVDNSPSELTYIVKSIPTNGTLKNGTTVLGLNDMFTQADIEAGNLTYTHDGSETTADSFTFDVADGAGGVLANQTFAITVSPVNDAPTLQTNEELELDEGASAVISTAYLAAADVDNTFSELTYTVKSLPTNGTLENGTTVLGLNDTFTQADINAGILTYTHDGSEMTTDSFEFDVADGAGGIIADQTFVIKITAVNDAPVAVADAYHALQNETLSVSADDGVLDNDTDVDSSSLKAMLVSGPINGTLNLQLDGSFTYTPNTDFYGLDTFTYKANDNYLDSNTVTVTISVGDVTPPDAPTIDLSETDWTHSDVTVTILGEAGGTIEYRVGEEVGWTIYTGAITLTDEGDYWIHARVTDASGNVGNEARTRVRIDKTAPQIDLHGDPEMTVYHESTFVDPGSTVIDILAPALTATVTGNVYTESVGTYTLHYNAIDLAGNKADEKVRIVHVIAKPTGLSFDAPTYTFDEKETVPFAVSMNFSNGHQMDVTGLSLYSFEPEGIASIETNGFLYGNQAGSTVIEAVYGGQTVQAAVTVRPIITQLQFDPSSLTLRKGETRTFKLEALYSDGSTVDITHLATYDISDLNIFELDTPGQLTALHPGTAKLKASYSSLEIELTVNVQEHSDNANLSNITLSDGTLTPAFTPGTTGYSATVAHAVREVTITANTEDARASVSIEGEPAETGTQAVTVPVHVGRNKLDITVTAEDGSVQTYTLDIWRKNRGGNTPGGQNSPSSSSPPSDFVMIINGVEFKLIGNVVKDTAPNGQSRITVELDTEKFEEKLREEGKYAKVIIPIPESTDQVVTKLDGSILELMHSLQTELEIRTPAMQYALPVGQLNLNDVGNQLDANMTFEVSIAVLTEEEASQVSEYAQQAKLKALLAPFSFTIERVKVDERVEITRFLGYVTRSFVLPDELDPKQITTGVVVLPDGSFHHVPTQVTERDGSYYAEISSLTNSTYMLINNEAAFDDVKHHWSKEIVNESASRLIVSGKSTTKFDPDSPVTRAEFAAMLNRGLGISQTRTEPSFNDVPRTAWFYDAVGAGEEYGLLAGFEDQTFRPRATITREEAMVMMHKAMHLAGITSELSDVQIEALLRPFRDSDAISTWSQAAVAASIDAGIVQGSHQRLSPKSKLTRAEAATLIMGLLKAADLI